MATLEQLKALAKDPRLQRFIGRTALIGLWQLYKNEPAKASQDFGTILKIDEMLVLATPEGKQPGFPITWNAIIPAPRGSYRLRMTEEVVIDPDYLLSWRLDIVDDIELSQWTANSAPHVYSLVGREWDFEYRHDRGYEEHLIEEYGEQLIGRTALVGIRRYGQASGKREFLSQTQEYGTIQHVSKAEGVILVLRDGSELSMPPDISLLQPAPEMEYTLQSTGEVISRPDYLAQWTTTETA